MACCKRRILAVSTAFLAVLVGTSAPADTKKTPAKPTPKEKPKSPPPPAVVKAATAPKPAPWKTFRDALGKATLSEVVKAVNLPATAIDSAMPQDLAVALYVLSQEGNSKFEKVLVSALAESFSKKIEKWHGFRVPFVKGELPYPKNYAPAEVFRYARFLRDRYSVPCEGKRERRSASDSPPVYRCEDARKDVALPTAPEQVVMVGRAVVVPAPPEEPPGDDGKPRVVEKLKKERTEWLAKTAKEKLPSEAGAPKPDKFCFEKACKGSYAEVARAIYGGGRISEKDGNAPTVFCRPAKKGEHATTADWSTTTTVCSSDWKDTVGKDLADSPAWACIGNPEFFSSIVLPDGGVGKDNGFRCRKRVFHVLQPEKGLSLADVRKGQEKMCSVMRRQTWGDDIERRVQQGCMEGKRPKDGEQKEEPLVDPPRWPLTREELLYFYGHKNAYCRANRKGLVHRCDNDKWANDQTFTCNVPRGLIESGPFEEGVQVCATTPYVDRVYAGIRHVLPGVNKGRLHCWRFNRPTCMEISTGDVEKHLWKSNVFDHLDMLGELRRTRNPDVLGIEDIKKVTEMPSFEVKEGLTYNDTAKDVGIGGVKEFCRFHGSGFNIGQHDGYRGRVICGYDQKTMAQWYELRAHETPEGCHDGICARGAYDRGYYCAVHQSPDIYDGTKKVWICGYDRSVVGREKIAKATWVCEGGRWVRSYLDSQGDRGSLRCGKRIFKWAESIETARKAAALEPLNFVRAWVARHVARPHEFKVFGVTIKSVDYGFDDVQPWRVNILLDQKMKEALIDRMKRLFDFLDDLHTDDVGFLGHRTAMRNYFLSDFKRNIKKRAPQILGILNDDVNKLFAVRSARTDRHDDIKALWKLFDDVMSNKRAPDGQWFQEVRNVVTDDTDPKKGLHMKDAIPYSQETVVAAFLHYALFEMLDDVRSKVLATAQDYYEGLERHAGNVSYLTRLELLEMARVAPVSPRQHGPIFCVEKLEAKVAKKGKAQETTFEPTGKYRCGSSPLLLAGAVEFHADKKMADFKAKLKDAWHERWRDGDLNVFTNKREDIRLEVKKSVAAGWCYGAVQGETAKVDDASYALEKAAQSPWVVEVPKREKDDERDGWLKCDRFQFADEVWIAALLKDEKHVEKEDESGGGGDAAEAYGLLGKVVAWLLAKLGGLDQVKDYTGIDVGLTDKYIEKLGALVKDAMNDVKKAIEEKDRAIEKANEDWEKAKGDFTDKAVMAASTPGDATSKAKDAAQQKVKDAEKKLKDARNDRDQARKAQKAAMKELKGSGEHTKAMTNELIESVTKRVGKYISPKAKSLLSDGMSFLKPLFDGIKTAVAGAVAGVPFAGGVLVMAVNKAFEWAWEKIIDLLTDKLMGVVERFLAMAVRSVLGPVVAAFRDTVTKGVRSKCNENYPELAEFCPQKLAGLPAADAWIDRALACGKREELSPRRRAEIAEKAEAEMYGYAARLVNRAPAIAKRIANRYLARVGHTLDSWTAFARAAEAGVAERLMAMRLAAEIENEVRFEVAARGVGR